MRLLLGDLLKDDSREALAQKIHEHYLTSNPSVPAGKPWTELPEHYKESNRLQADDMFRKLLEMRVYCPTSQNDPGRTCYIQSGRDRNYGHDGA